MLRSQLLHTYITSIFTAVPEGEINSVYRQYRNIIPYIGFHSMLSVFNKAHIILFVYTVHGLLASNTQLVKKMY